MILIPEASACPPVGALEPCASELRLLGAFPGVADIDRVVAPRAGVRFEASAPKPRRARRQKSRAPIDPDELYDGRITKEGVVPTRPESAHDLWNALVWSAFPRSKRALHARQHRLISARLDASAKVLPGARTREQDTIAMVDEGGAILVCDEGAAREVESALSTRTTEALDAVKSLFTGLVFGHAVYEELARGPTRALCFAVLVEAPRREPGSVVATADELLRGMLEDPERFLSPEGHRGIPPSPAWFADPRPR